MKNIITILLILFVPVIAYLTISSKSDSRIAYATNPNNPSIIIFTSTMCKDCQTMKELLKDVESKYNDKINFVYINALARDRKVQDKIKKYSITLVPTLVFTDTNELQTKKIEGAIPKEELVIAIEDSINE